jgi:hypothetical protein
MYCSNCSKEISPDSKVCPECGNVVTNNTGSTPKIACRFCGSHNLDIISEVSGEGAKLWKLCCFGFCGLCGAGKTTTTHYWVCKDCGKRFKA